MATYTPISGNLLVIGGVNCAGWVSEYTVDYAKLWKDAERNMSGDVRATLIGNFNKLKVKFRAGLTTEEFRRVSAVLARSYFSVTYYDPKSGSQKTAQYYASDYEVSLMDRTRGIYDEFSVSLVPVSKDS